MTAPRLAATHLRHQDVAAGPAAAGRVDRHRFRGAGLGDAAGRSRWAARSGYSDIASRISSPKASRAVGAAVGRNPLSFVVPCHRALGKSGGADRLPLGHHPQAGRCSAGKRARWG